MCLLVKTWLCGQQFNPPAAASMSMTEVDTIPFTRALMAALGATSNVPFPAAGRLYLITRSPVGAWHFVPVPVPGRDRDGQPPGHGGLSTLAAGNTRATARGAAWQSDVHLAGYPGCPAPVPGRCLTAVTADGITAEAVMPLLTAPGPSPVIRGGELKQHAAPTAGPAVHAALRDLAAIIPTRPPVSRDPPTPTAEREDIIRSGSHAAAHHPRRERHPGPADELHGSRDYSYVVRAADDVGDARSAAGRRPQLAEFPAEGSAGCAARILLGTRAGPGAVDHQIPPPGGPGKKLRLAGACIVPDPQTRGESNVVITCITCADYHTTHGCRPPACPIRPRRSADSAAACKLAPAPGGTVRSRLGCHLGRNSARA